MNTLSPFLRALGAALGAVALCACSDMGSDMGSGHAADTDGGAELLRVAERGDLNRLDSLLRKQPDPDVRDLCDWTPLMKAALNGHLDVVRHLLDADAEVDATDKGGYTAMMLAASNDHATVVDLLLDRGAMADHQEQTLGWTALIWAAKQGHRKTVDALLNHGADAALPDFSGRRAADWARELGLRELHTALEQVAADPG